jgi:hypothetical protein
MSQNSFTFRNMRQDFNLFFVGLLGHVAIGKANRVSFVVSVFFKDRFPECINTKLMKRIPNIHVPHML